MSKILHYFNILFFYAGCFVFFLFFMPSFTVKAEDFSMYVDPGPLFFSDVYHINGYSSLEYIVSGSPAVYQVSTAVTDWRPTFNQIDTGYTYMFLAFDIDKQPVLRSSGPSEAYFTSGNYSKVINGVTHTVYFKFCSGIYFFDRDNFSDDTKDIHPIVECTGTQIFPSYQITNNENCIKVCNFFLFGEGSLDYDKPAQDIEDADLDIVGLIGSSSSSIDTDPSTLSGFMSNFVKNVLNLFSGGLFAGSLGSGDIFNSSVPSCRLVWDSPSVSTINDYGDSSTVSYSIWVDGKCKINLYQVGEWVDGTSCSFSHLVLHDAPILYNGVSSFYYSTGSDYQTILNYALNNSSFVGGTTL